MQKVRIQHPHINKTQTINNKIITSKIIIITPFNKMEFPPKKSFNQEYLFIPKTQVKAFSHQISLLTIHLVFNKPIMKIN